MLAALAALAASAISSAATPVPALVTRVSDLAQLLPEQREAALEARLSAFERETSHQIAILTVPSLDEEPIEDFSVRVFDGWRLGRADADNGVLIVVAPNERRARIEVGYGLEGALPDVVAGRIVQERMVPHFREGDFATGIEDAADAVMAAARGELLAPPARVAPSVRTPADPFVVVLFLSIFGGVLASPLRHGRLRPIAALVAGGFSASLTARLLGVGGWVALAMIAGALFGWVGPTGGRALRRGGFGVPGGFGGGGDGFGGGGGGGWSGGGGRSGGGGASGSW